MKNKIYYIGIICCILITVGCVFKIMHWPLAGILFTIGFILFSLLFMPVALFNSFKVEKEPKYKWLYIIAFICNLLTSAGALFKVMHWSGAAILMVISLPLPFILFLPVYLIQVNKNKQLNYNNLLLVLFFFAYFGAISALLSLNVSKNVIDDGIVITYNQQEKIEYVDNLTTDMIDNLPVNKDSLRKIMVYVKNESDNIMDKIDNIELQLVESSDRTNHSFVDNSGTFNLWCIDGKDSRLNISMEKLKNEIKQVEEQLIGLKNILLINLTGKDQETITFVNKLLTNNIMLVNENENYTGQRLIFTLQSFTTLKLDISMATYETLSAVIN